MDSDSGIASLIRKAQAGDRPSFDALFATYAGRVEAFIRSQAGVDLAHKVEVHDLLQETFLEAWRDVGSFRGGTGGELFSWLKRIAEHTIGMQARRFKAKKRAAEGEVSLAQQVRTPEGGFGELIDLLRKSTGSPSSAIRRDERFDRLQRAFDTLSPDHRKVILLSRVEELPTEEVARRMARSPEAVSMLLYRALLKLRDAFGYTESYGLPDRRLEDRVDGG